MTVFGLFVDLYIVIMIASYNFLAHDKNLRTYVLHVNSLILVWFTSLDLILAHTPDSMTFGYIGIVGSTIMLAINTWARWNLLEEKRPAAIDI